MKGSRKSLELHICKYNESHASHAWPRCSSVAPPPRLVLQDWDVRPCMRITCSAFHAHTNLEVHRPIYRAHTCQRRRNVDTNERLRIARADNAARRGPGIKPPLPATPRARPLDATKASRSGERAAT